MATGKDSAAATAGSIPVLPHGAERVAASNNVARHGGLPYGAVMATAGASTLAARCGLHALVVPLLALAVAQALWVPLTTTWQHRRGLGAQCRAWCTIGGAGEHAGIHTVPLGLAVIAGGFAALTADGAGTWLVVLGWVSLGLTWLLMVVCVGRFAWALAFRRTPLRSLGGAWFLVPAALLGAGIAADAVARLAAGSTAAILAALALAATLCGWLGYWAVAGVALARVWRFRLGGVPQAPWWIAMGCAGLAAAALGGAVRVPAGDAWLQQAFGGALVLTIVVAIILCVPVLVGSVTFLARHCRFRAAAAWPPTFSTAVFALGCLESATVLHAPALRLLGLGAGYATLVFWAVTMAWNTGRACACRLQRR
ncbi:MAG TPA: hypothetical protein VF292_16070 [Rhodanobacteraceae bacterium]